MPRGTLRSDVIIEPLWNEWHAWPLLVPPITAGLVTERHHIPRLESYLRDPERHARAARDPRALGGPWVAVDPERAGEVEALLARSRERSASRVALARALRELDAHLETETGGSLAAAYSAVPAPLRGFVELVYDRRNVAAAKPFETLLLESFADPALESFDLFVDDGRRSFAFSTPRLRERGHVRIDGPFSSPVIDRLARARTEPDDIDELARALNVAGDERETFAALFSTETPSPPERHTGSGVRVRYFGHATVLLETAETAVLVDPWLGHPKQGECLGFADLPAHIDVVLITHGHADHLMLETLIQLRHRVGEVVVPRSGWGILDPSLASILRHAGFPAVREVDAYESVSLADGRLRALPFLGEHADLAIRAKATYAVELRGRTFVFAADANNLEPRVYAPLSGRGTDVLFVGMECVGASLDWLYGEFLSRPVTREQAASRRLDGSDAAKALSLVDALAPSAAAFVYALGAEPWLTWLSAVRYDATSPPIVESDRFVAACAARGLHSERLFGSSEFVVDEAAP